MKLDELKKMLAEEFESYMKEDDVDVSVGADDVDMDADMEPGKGEEQSPEEALEKIYSDFPLLSDRKKDKAGNLSGGQRQILALGRALITSPNLLLLDEPSAGLSPVAINEVFTSIKEINESGVSILLVEQNAKRALGFSDRGYVLDQGRNAYQGSGEELLNDPRVIDLYLGKI